MTNKEIIKGLECCVVEREYPYCDSRKCPYFDATNTYTECKKMLIKDVCNTVKRQQAEIERLTAQNGVYETCCARKDEAIRGLEADVEGLRKAIKVLECMNEQHQYDLRKRKSKAIQEYKERVKQELLDDSFFPVFVKNALDKVEKEMAGD